MRSSRLLLLSVFALGLIHTPARGDARRTAPEEYRMKVSVEATGLETARVDSAFTPVHDTWTGFDKVQHTTFSFLWVLGNQYVLVNKADWQEGRALPLSIGMTASLGVAKELYDWQFSPSRHFSWKDLVADLVGISAGILLVLY